MGLGKNKRIKIGYSYYFGIHMGLGRGPVDEITHIKVGDKTAWQDATGSGWNGWRYHHRGWQDRADYRCARADPQICAKVLTSRKNRSSSLAVAA